MTNAYDAGNRMEINVSNNTDCIRVLQLNAGSKNFGGVSAFLYNIYTHIDKNKVQFDFLSPFVTTYGLHRKEIEDAGGRIFELGVKGNIITRKFDLYKKLKEFIKTNNYKIVHINSGDFLFNIITVKAAKKAGVPIRIIHSHSSGDHTKMLLKSILHYLLKFVPNKNATQLFACSDKAAKYMFSKKIVLNKQYKIIKNGILTENFSYSEDKRNEVRNKLNLKDKFVVGNIGRFVAPKNHTFMIDVFAALIEKRPDAVLMLAGTGELEETIRKKVHDLRIEDKVLFMGQHSDINDLYQAMDVFFLPSVFEGFGIVNIEAQSSGLICVTSDAIPEAADVTNTMIRLSLDSPVSVWVDSLISAEGTERKNLADEVKKAGYDIRSVAKEMENYYLNAYIENQLR